MRKKYYLIEKLDDETYKELDSSYSKPTMELRKKLNERTYHKTNLLIISRDK